MNEKAKSSTAIIYLRGPFANTKNSGTDRVDEQRIACKRTARSLGAKILTEYIDEGEDVSAGARTGRQRMLNEMVEHPVDFVIVSRLHHLSRSFRDHVSLLEAIEMAGGSLVSSDEGPISGRMLRTILKSISEFESRARSEAVKRGIARRRRVKANKKAEGRSLV